MSSDVNTDRRHHFHRKMAENDDAADGQSNDDKNNNNDDGANNNDDAEDAHDKPGQDDFFDDFLQDDLVYRDDDAGSNRNYDDFYVFEKDRKTPHLMPLQTGTIVGFFIASLALTVGSTSGTGGGGILVPVYILVMGLPIQAAIPIGAVTVLGGSIASTSMNWTRRHPLADRVLIDWDLVRTKTVFLPLLGFIVVSVC
jgi:hypothetical protein